MRIFDMVSMCLGNLFRRKMRTMLTITGVIVGTCAIVIMISLGIGMTISQEAKLAEMGDLTVINVMNYNQNNAANGGEPLIMDDAAIAQMQALPGVVVATPIYNPTNITPTLLAGKKDRYMLSYANIVGMYSSAMPLMGYQLLDGKYPTGPQADKKKPIYVVVGQYTDYDFQDTKSKYNSYVWPETDENGNVIKDPFVDMFKDEIRMTTLSKEELEDKENEKVAVEREIVAVARLKEDWNKGYETSRGIIMDIEDLKRLEEEHMKANKIRTSDNQKKGYNRATVKVESLEDVDPVETAIKAMGFETSSMETIRKPMQEQVRQQQMFLGIMGGISLMVAAIGIANTMTMSIYERTREIGVMKVLGCLVGNIRSIFLMEAGVIGFIGGCLGVAISYAVSFCMNYFQFSFSGLGGESGGGMIMMGAMGMGMENASSTLPVSVIPLWLVGAAILFATLMGLLSGIMPANRAMKISALEAIKHE